MHSHFNAQTLAEILRDLFVSESTGVLTLTCEESEQRLYFDRGLIFYAESDHEELDLGHRLVEEGKISQGALDEARANVAYPYELPHALVNRDLLAKDALSSRGRESSAVGCSRCSAGNSM